MSPERETLKPESIRRIHMIIVEDETLVRLGMKLCIEQSRELLDVTGAFPSAEEALFFMNCHPVDLLLTDIRLEKMNGLELAREARLRYPNLCVVIISCYNDFEYARQGIHLNIDRYLLKHEIDEQELPHLLYRLTEDKLQRQNQNPFPIMSAEPKAFNLDGHFRLGLIQLIQSYPKDRLVFSEGNSNLSTNLSMLMEILQGQLDHYKLGQCFLRHGNEIFCLFNFDNSQGNTLSEETACNGKNRELALIGAFYRRIKPEVKNYFNLEFHLLLSPEYQNLQETSQFYKLISQKRELLFFYNDAVCLSTEQMARFCTKADRPRLSLDSGTPLILFSKSWQESILKTFYALIEFARCNGMSPFEFKTEIAAFLQTAEAYIEKHHVKAYRLFTETHKSYLSQIQEASDITFLSNWFSKYIEELCLAVNQQDKLIQQIDFFILSHYTQSITLPQIADNFHMNPAYFCHYFKKMKGISLITYINDLRVEQAKELLSTDDLTLEEVARQVGIENANYFARLFKKISGQTFSSYKQKIQKVSANNLS